MWTVRVWVESGVGHVKVFKAHALNTPKRKHRRLSGVTWSESHQFSATSDKPSLSSNKLSMSSAHSEWALQILAFKQVNTVNGSCSENLI